MVGINKYTQNIDEIRDDVVIIDLDLEKNINS